jgi:dTDP-4-amino-4,6-dideoxygalactose transaminase
MTDIQAALGLAQLQKIEKFLKRRRYLAERYNEGLKDLPVVLPYQHPETESAWHLYVIRVEAARRREIFEHLRAEGILVNVHYIPVHTQPYYKKLGFKTGDFPEAEQYYRGAITLPLHYGLSDKEQDYVIERLQEIIR